MTTSVQLKGSDCFNSIDKPYHVFAEFLEQGAIDQFVEVMTQPFVVKGAMMADAHTGYSMPIGGVVATDGVIVPAYVGYDIGCGMCAVPTSFNIDDVRKNAKKIFDNIYRDIPVGFNHNQKDTEWSEGNDIPMTSVVRDAMNKNGLKQLGSLGSGNHFIEIGADKNDKVWIIIHSGSRNIGHTVATHYMKLASGTDKAVEGHDGFCVYSLEGKQYIMDMNFCLAFALQNRKEMMHRVDAVLMRYCGGFTDWDRLINRNHNHAELKDGVWIHRKGACSANVGEMNAIPGNMRDGVFITQGLGNNESLCSSSHGAGRVLGRKEAKRTLDMQTFSDSMGGIIARISEDTIDESPAAYKDIFNVMELQKSLVEIVNHIKPIINIKG